MALSVEEISKEVQEFASKYKRWESEKAKTPINSITKTRIGVSQYPEYWDGYNYSARMYDSIIPHTRADIYPEKLLSVRAPNQSDAQAEYIKANYKATTLSVFEDFKATISRSFADQNWSVSYMDEKDGRFANETFANYVNKEIEKYGSVENFVKSMLPTLKLTDPNGIIAVEPDDLLPGGMVEAEGTENAFVLGNDLVKPVPVYYNCKDIVGQEYGEWYLVITDEESIVRVGSKNERTGLVLKFYDNENIWVIYQVGKKVDMTFSEPELYFQHGLGYVPCQKLMGQPQLIESELTFQSPFATAVPLLDQVVLDESYLQISKATSAFPFMIALGEICDFTDREGNKCDSGQIFDPVNGGYRTCSSCNGNGVRSRFTPTGMLLVKPKTTLSEGDSGLSGEYMKFVSPPMDTLTFLRSEITSNIYKSREILHLPASDQAGTIGESTTATGSLNKLRALYAFIKPISDQLFNLYEFILVTSGNMRYGEYFGGVTLVYPTSFDISTPSDYLAVISEGVKAGVPPAITYANVYNYIKAINYTDAESTAINDLVVAADELLLMSSVDITTRIANGTIEKWQDVLHQSAPQLIMELIRTHIPTAEAPMFIDLPMQDQINKLNELAASRVRIQLDPIAQAQATLLNGIV